VGLFGNKDKDIGQMTTEELKEHNREARNQRHADAFRLREEAVRQGRDDLVQEIDEQLLFDAD